MNDLLKRIEQLEKENKVLQTMLESSQGNTKAWVKKYEEVAGKLETFKCGSCGVIHKTTRGKMTFDLDCVSPECYGTMQVVKDLNSEGE